MVVEGTTYRHDCSRGGPGQNCFLQRHALRFSAFNEVLPGLIRLSDVDGICEINERILLIESKSSGVIIGTGQRRLFEAFSKKEDCQAVVIFGDVQTGVFSEMEIYFKGRSLGRKPVSSQDILSRLEEWSVRAKARCLTRAPNAWNT